ncbi:MAG: hypothetical protein U5L09_08935 [Bacteroidales bacterium]|nr:hypothetical protein [Bacteroidales bacterium]
MNFCKIKSVLNHSNEENITTLSLKYNNTYFLKKSIKDVSTGFLDNPKLIKNKSVLLKPNWVTHNRKANDDLCLRTHDNFILATLEIILEQNPKKVTIGDAPIQGCDWYKMLSSEFIGKINELSKKFNVPVNINDFRRVTFNPSNNNITEERNPLSDY